MYCERCERTAPVGRRDGGAGADRFGNLQCQRCGTLLQPELARELGRKVALLAKFGLADPEPTPGEGA